VKLRAYYLWAVRTDENEGNPNPVTVKGKKVQQNILPVMNDAVHQAMLKACGRNTLGRRDKAIISLLHRSGLRRSEICMLNLDSYRDDSDRPALIIGSVEFATKSRKARLVPLTPETVALLDRYMLRRGDAPGPLFYSARGEGHRLSANGVSQIVERLMKAAGVEDSYGVHSYRRAWAIDAREAGLSDASIMDIAGWEDITQLVRYTKSKNTQLAHDEFYAKMTGDNATKKRQPMPRILRSAS